MTTPSTTDLYRELGAAHGGQAMVVYGSAICPHEGCQQWLQAIDFRLEAVRPHCSRSTRPWWADTGFAGRCPNCSGWIHFTVRGKRAISENEAATLPQLPENWADEAVIL